MFAGQAHGSELLGVEMIQQRRRGRGAVSKQGVRLHADHCRKGRGTANAAALPVESATGPKFLAPGFLWPAASPRWPRRVAQAGQAKRSFVFSTIAFQELGFHGNF
jgi:hypothetical protein